MILEPGKRYLVIEATDEALIPLGSQIWSEDDGAIRWVFRDRSGWISSQTLFGGLSELEVELDREWIEKRKAEIRAELDELGELGG